MMTSRESRDIRSLLTQAVASLPPDRFDTPRLDAELILGDVLGCDRAEFYRRPERELTDLELNRFNAALERRRAGEPVAYIRGRRDFFGHEFRVSPAVLIPRPETEHLVEHALEFLRSRGITSPRVLDVGTGSGCVALSIAAAMPNARVTAWDISPDALELARANARLLDARNVDFERRDALSAESWSNAGPYDVIVSNPPYVSAREFAALSPSVRDFEPTKALLASENGLQFYSFLATHAAAACRPTTLLAVEIGWTQGLAVRGLLESNGWTNVVVHKDLAGHDRVVTALTPETTRP